MVKSVINKPSKQTTKNNGSQSTVVKRQAIPASFGYSMRGVPADMKSTGKDVRVRHSEYIGEVNGSVNFNVKSYVIQPSTSNSFPWLHNMASLYESYTIHKLHYRFESSKSTATNGAVIMAIDYDTADSAPPSKTQLMAYNNYVRSSVWEATCYKADPRDLKLIVNRFIRQATTTVTDSRLYDAGILYIATQGCADTSVIGELHVDYEISLHTPQLDLGSYASGGSNRSTGSTGITNALILGTSPNLNAAGSGLTITYNTTTGAISLGQPGQYLINYQVSSTSAYTGTVSVTLTGGSVANSPSYVASTTLALLSFTVNMVNADDTFTVGGWVAGSTPSGAVLKVASYPVAL